LQDLIVYFLLIAGIILSVNRKKLTVNAAIVAGFVGLFVYKGAGSKGLAMLVTFFLLGSFATSLFITKKQGLGIAEHNSGQRTTGQVIANGGVAAILAAIAWYKPLYAPLLQLMMAGSLASATADTLSSELGSVYGRKFYDILSFKKSNPGPDGVVSLEGTLIGIAGSILIAFVYAIGFGLNYYACFIVIAGGLGNLMDSFLGATLERKHFIENNTVNFLNTATGALICWVFYIIVK
jgi:uncharacterized protein (TIGR00297 family)